MAQKGIIKNTTAWSFGAAEFSSVIHSIFGASGILDVFNKLACTKINDNTVRLDSGMFSVSGYLVRVDPGTTESFTIVSGTTGYNRNDLVVAEFVRNGGGAGEDTGIFKIIAGTPTTGTAADPALTREDVNGSGTTRQEALYRVSIVGTAITAITMLTKDFAYISKAVQYMQGSGTLTAGVSSYTVTDAFISPTTRVDIEPTSTKLGTWAVNSFAGYFTITSTVTETTAVTFDWSAMK